ncbi:superinfection immunity protein [Flavobacterium sp.]|jgi:hypothetical protein|uniref:superinfection immunity protein n=1 Tax=Flavobacterium sp. TaxID=239 RepID=UPI0037C0531F
MNAAYSIAKGIGFFILNVFTFCYFLPSTVAYYRRDKCGNVNSIFVLNLFLGWTLVGWVIALIWAMKDKPQPQVIIVQSTSEIKG